MISFSNALPLEHAKEEEEIAQSIPAGKSSSFRVPARSMTVACAAPSDPGGPKTVRINPRTGKPLTLPQPLSLSPHEMSPIRTEAEVPPGSQMIREEHEEASSLSSYGLVFS